jgi:uncharacterized protein (TIGR02145 family)
VKHLYVFGLFLLLPFFGFSQGEFNNWYFGAPPNGAAVTFNSGSPVAIPNGVMSSGGVTVNVSDSSGNLLFFSDGHKVFNRNKNVMPNGLGLFGTSSGGNQGVLAVQKPGNDSLYYIFTVGYYNPTGTTYGLLYSIVNMNLDGGLGDIEFTNKNIPVTGAGNAWIAVTGTRHHNNRDIWIVTTITSVDSINYACYLLDSAGLHITPILSQSIGIETLDPPLPPYILNPNSIRISSDGTKLVECYGNGTKSEFCSFDNSTGKVIRHFFIVQPLSYGPGNAEFSIESKYLYRTYSTSSKNFTYQYDATQLDSLQFAQSKITIDSNQFRSYLQMAPDFKIYCSETFQDSLAVIQYPSNLGTACNYQHGAVGLTGACSDGLPQFVQRYKAYIHSNGSCQGKAVSFSGDIYPPPDSLHWDFGDPASGLNNFSNLPNPAHLYSNTGTYTIELFVRHIDNRTDTSWQTITIVASPQPNLGSARTICQGDSILLDAGACAGCIYVWDNLTLGLMNIATTQTYYAKTTANFRVSVTNSNGCIGSDTVLVTFTPVPQVSNNPLSKSICSGESTNISLTANVVGTTFNWTASLTSGNITGFSADSGQIINQVLINNGVTTGIVTYHITPKVGSCIGNTIDYTVSVTQGTAVTINITSSTNNVCQGTSVTFNAHTTYGGTSPSFQWKVNGVVSVLNDSIFTYTPANADVVSCTLTSSNTVCVSNNPATSNSITMNILPLQPVSVSVSALNPVCAGTSVTYSALPTNGGSLPTYQWKVNGIVQGANLSTFTYVPLNGDIITCTLLSNAGCPTNNPATSPPLTMIVNPNLAVIVSISTPTNPFCLGSSVTFTAAPTNGGVPIYQWQVNGGNGGGNSSTYSYFPAGGDVVTCIMNSSLPCTIGNPATSNPITMVVNTGLPAGVTITATQNPFCPGSSVTFTATPTNGGTPVYQWKVNGINVGINSNTYTYNPVNNDSVRCIMTSNLGCVTGNPASSAMIIMSGTLAPIVTFTSCFDTITTINAKPIKLKGGIPLGGIYSGPGVNSVTGIYTPALAGVGTHTITYTYTNATLCSAAKSISILNLPSSILACGNPLTDPRDNRVYQTVQIGIQCWLATNLNFGATIASTQDQRDNCISEKYCYNDNPVNCTNYGGLYQWDEVMRFAETPAGQGFCPPAWHIPTENDWNTLFATFINNAFAGSPLKYSGYSGFNAILSGARHINRGWDFQGFATFFWSSTARSDNKAWAHGMNDPDPSVSNYPASRVNAFSVRCLKD